MFRQSSCHVRTKTFARLGCGCPSTREPVMKVHLICLLPVALALAAATGQSAGVSQAPGQAAIYARPFVPAVAPALLPLPPGAVEPAGWLRDWAFAARDGITGHLDEWHPAFAGG